MGIHDGHRQRKRELLLTAGSSRFADYELLEMLLYYAIPRRNTSELAHLLLEECGSLEGVLTTPVEKLEKLPGMGRNTATLLHLVSVLQSRALMSACPEKILRSADDAGDYFVRLLQRERREVVYQVCIDRKGKVLRSQRLSEGSVDLAVLDVRRVVENALLCDASGVFLAHNHPSGIALPSGADRQVTLQVRDALRLVNIQLIDHIIVADGDYVSMAASGELQY